MRHRTHNAAPPRKRRAHRACIGWEADPPCPTHGQFHGCIHPDGHVGTHHECACGDQPPGARGIPRTPASLRGRTPQPSGDR